MRNLSLLRILLLGVMALFLATGCGKGSTQSDAITEEEAKAQGLVWDPQSESWGYPNTGYDDVAQDSEDEYEEDDAADSSYDDDEGMDASNSDANAAEDNADDEDDDAASDSAASSNSNDGYGDYGGYGGYGGQSQGDPKYYAEKVVPILRTHCYNCHGGGPQGEKGGIALHSPTDIDEFALVSAGDLEGSILYELASADRNAENKMPPKGPGLSKTELQVIAKWITDGASFGDAPRDVATYVPTGAGDGYGGGGDPYANSGYGGTSDGEYGDDEDSDAPAAPVRPQNLAEWASLSFQNGRDNDAMKQLYAQALVRSEDGKAVLEKYRWVPALKRPKLAVRWGVGIKYTAKMGFEGSPRAVGVVQNLPGDEFDDVEESEDEVGDIKNDTLDYYAGDIGDELILRLKLRIGRSFYGEILREQLEKSLAGRGDDEDDEFYDDDNSGYGGGGRGGYGGGAYGSGGYGRSNGDDDSSKPDGDRLEQIMPGVTLLGVASNTDLFTRANEQAVDLLVIFDVTADPNNRRRFVDTSTRVRLYDVATQEQIATTGKINNIEIQKLRVEDPDDETIIKEMDKIFTVIDKTYKMKPFPDVSSEKAQKSVVGFVRTLLSQTSENPLWKLSEVRFYEHRGGLKKNYVDSAFRKILPQQAEKLKSVATDDEIRSLLANWLTVKETLADGDAEDNDSGSGDDDFR